MNDYQISVAGRFVLGTCWKYATCSVVALFFHLTSVAQTSSLVSLQNGQLSYTPYAMQNQSNAVNTIPDFSFAGYKGGGVALPDVPVRQTVSPVAGDDRLSIQNAIDAVEALTPDTNGFRGAVLLTAGHYEVDGQLFIETSGVVLRGEGQGSNGTVIHANQQSQHDFLTLRGTGTGITLDLSTVQSITTSYVPVGAYSFGISDASGYAVGDTIAVRRTPNQFWIDELAVGQYGWTSGSYEINHERIVTAITGNTISVDLPIVDVMETQYGGGEVYKASIPGRINNCGVENLRIESYYASNNDESHGWNAIVLNRVVNSWVKKVTAQYFGYSTVNIGRESNFNTVEEAACIDHKSLITGGRRYSFTIKDGIGNLFQRCYTREGRHDFETGSRVTGPNVFLDNYSANTYADIGPHHRWSTGILFDNVRGGQIRVHNRGSSGTGHGWVGSAIVFWNLESYKNDIKVSSPKGGRNFGIGCSGLSQNGGGFWEHWNSPVTPRSLYLQQLEDRLGQQAVDNIAIPEQKTGDIYGLLTAWAGEGDLIQGNENPIDTTLATLSPTADTYVRAGTHANTNFGTDSQLIVKENSGTPDNDRMSFVKYDLGGIMSGQVSVAKIRFRVNNGSSEANHSLHMITIDSWTETGVTWNNKPATGSLIEDKTVPAIAGYWIEYDVTDEVNNELSGDGTISFQLSESTQDHFFTYHSREATSSDNHPVLAYEESSVSLTLTAIEDATVRGGSNSSNNYGSDVNFVVKENTGTPNNDRMSFVKFDLSSISGDVTNAIIRLKVQNDDPGSSHNLNLVADDSWTEGSITWSNKPSTGGLLGTQLVPAIGSWLEINVTDEVNTELSGDGLISVLISESTTNTFVGYHSTEAASPEDHPQLIYEIASSNPPPTEVSISITEDAYVQGGSSANTNFGSNGILVVKANTNASHTRETFLKVDLSSISGNLSSAKVRLKIQNDDSGVITHALNFVSDDSWTESGITFNNKPSHGTTLNSSTVPIIGEWLEFDVLSQAQTETSGDGFLSLKLIETTNNSYIGYFSSEAANAGDRPEFVYTTSSTGARFGNEGSLENQVLELESNELIVYPNPVTDRIKIRSQQELRKLIVLDATGKRILSIDDPTKELSINLSQLKAGAYFMKMYMINGSQETRIITKR